LKLGIRAFILILIVVTSLEPSQYASGMTETTTQRLVDLVDGDRSYDSDLQLEKMTLDHATSAYSFRSSGSPGATAAAHWLVDKYRELGIDARAEDFSFVNWTLLSPPTFLLDLDNNASTTNDQLLLPSFIAKHLAWPTGREGVFGQVVILPLPQYGQAFPSEMWDNITIKGKIVIIGREFGLFPSWRDHYITKITSEPPLAIIHTWWFPNDSWVPPYTGSQEGRLYSPAPPTSSVRYWDLKIPVGMINYDDGLKIRAFIQKGQVSAKVVIDSVIGFGPHYNVVAVIPGEDENKIIIISSHYDTVMSAGFGDNGAGTSGLLELARVFQTAKKDGIYVPPVSLMFVSFAAEEYWLLGSSYFIKQHKLELSKVLEVINLDPIGSQVLLVSKTDSDLSQAIVGTAQDLDVPVTTVSREEASSDNWSFDNPAERDGAISWIWSEELKIADAPSTPSVWLGSYPLQWTDTSPNGEHGWIHTPYDNSTSTSNYDWMTAMNMQAQLKVVALAVLRIAPTATFSTPPTYTYIVAIFAASILLATIIHLKQRDSKKADS
jgi:hypothetical protein